MHSKEIRAKLLKQAGRLVDQLRDEDSIGGTLALIASSPFTDTEAGDYLINAIIATGTPAQLAQAYGLPVAAAEVMHSLTVANVTMKKRPGKDGEGSMIAKMLREMAEGKRPKEDEAGTPPEEFLNKTFSGAGDEIANAFKDALQAAGIEAKVAENTVELRGTPEEIQAQIGDLVKTMVKDIGKKRRPTFGKDDCDCTGCKLLKATKTGIEQGLFTEAEMNQAAAADEHLSVNLIEKVEAGTDPLTAITEALGLQRH